MFAETTDIHLVTVDAYTTKFVTFGLLLQKRLDTGSSSSLLGRWVKSRSNHLTSRFDLHIICEVVCI